MPAVVALVGLAHERQGKIDMDVLVGHAVLLDVSLAVRRRPCDRSHREGLGLCPIVVPIKRLVLVLALSPLTALAISRTFGQAR